MCVVIFMIAVMLFITSIKENKAIDTAVSTLTALFFLVFGVIGFGSFFKEIHSNDVRICKEKLQNAKQEETKQYILNECKTNFWVSPNEMGQ